MTATPWKTARETALWTIWAEGFAAIGESGTAWQLNEEPVRAESLDEAVLRHIRSGGSGHLFRRDPDGSWTYWGCRLFDNEQDARASFG